MFNFSEDLTQINRPQSAPFPQSLCGRPSANFAGFVCLLSGWSEENRHTCSVGWSFRASRAGPYRLDPPRSHSPKEERSCSPETGSRWHEPTQQSLLRVTRTRAHGHVRLSRNLCGAAHGRAGWRAPGGCRGASPGGDPSPRQPPPEALGRPCGLLEQGTCPESHGTCRGPVRCSLFSVSKFRPGTGWTTCQEGWRPRRRTSMTLRKSTA